MIKEITKREFEERYPEVYISDAGQVAAYLENGVVLTESEWNGEIYAVKDENGEVLQYDVIGYEEV